MGAKVIRVSDDSGATWKTLPGATGSFDGDNETQDDTIFGNSYRSQEVGLLTWQMGANAFYKGFAGYLAEIYEPGTSTAFTDEAMALESGLIYAISDGTKDLWNRSVAIAVEDNAIAVADADIEWIDYLFGRIKFVTGYSVTGPITVSGEYYPKTQLGKANSYSLSMQAETKDTSDYATVQGNGGYRTFEPGLRTVELELGGIFDAAVDALGKLTGRSEIMVVIDPAGDGKSTARGFFKPSSISDSGDVGAVEEESISFTLTVPDEDTMLYPFGWQHASDTTLSEAVRILIAAFQDETLIDAQYLPEGTTGNTPLDGKEGSVVVTNVSLSGALDAMNTFDVELTGSGAVTEV